MKGMGEDVGDQFGGKTCDLFEICVTSKKIKVPARLTGHRLYQWVRREIECNVCKNIRLETVGYLTFPSVISEDFVCLPVLYC